MDGDPLPRSFDPLSIKHWHAVPCAKHPALSGNFVAGLYGKARQTPCWSSVYNTTLALLIFHEKQHVLLLIILESDSLHGYDFAGDLLHRAALPSLLGISSHPALTCTVTSIASQTPAQSLFVLPLTGRASLCLAIPGAFLLADDNQIVVEAVGEA